MKINYSDQSVLKGEISIFLAGPTPRSLDVETWRRDAIKILEQLGFDGIVYFPERNFDDRTFDYNDQVLWEREALNNASVIVFWVPRNILTLPGYTTNVEFGYWIAKGCKKVIYGRPDDSEKNRYLDWLYETETGRQPINNLTTLLKGAIMMAREEKNDKYYSYELEIINYIIEEYPEIKELVGEVHASPESIIGKNTFGQMLYKGANPEHLKEFDRTILSILLYFYIKDNKYDKFVEMQEGDNKLSRKTFDEIRGFMLSVFNTPEKEKLLLYYVVINDLGKSKKLENDLKEKGIETVNHDVVLKYLVQYNMLTSLNNFDEESIRILKNILDNGINVGQFIQGECVDYSCDKLRNLSLFEKQLMMAEALLDIGGVRGASDNRHGSKALDQSTADNINAACSIIFSSMDSSEMFEKFLIQKADEMQIKTDELMIRKTITRICLMMRLYRKSDIQIVENEIINNLGDYETLIWELNQSGYNNAQAILLYYSPALLNNAFMYFKEKAKSENPIRDALKVGLPFIQRVMQEVRESINGVGNGIITVMLEEASKIALNAPYQISSFGVDVAGKEEVTLKRVLKKTDD